MERLIKTVKEKANTALNREQKIERRKRKKRELEKVAKVHKTQNNYQSLGLLLRIKNS